MPNVATSGFGYKIDILGGEEMAKNIASLDKALAKKVVRVALRRAAKVSLKRAKELVPVDTGALRDSLRIKVGRIRNDEIKEAKVYLTAGRKSGDRKAGYYAFQVEYGTKHAKARPYLRPAVEQTREQFAKDIQEEIVESWQKNVVDKGL